MSDQASSIRRLYFYLVSFIALGFIVGSSVYVLNYVAKVTIFQQADTSYRGTPPPPILIDMKTGVTSAPACEPSCSLSESDRLSLQNWQQQYEQWQAQPTANTNRTRGLVNALSFLIVALPVFWFHFRSAQRDAKEEALQNPDPKRAGRTIRSFYFYLVALAAVVIFIISAGVTVNTSLKTWLLDDSTQKVSTPITSNSVELTSVTSLLACAEKCKLDAPLVTQLNQWQQDSKTAQTDIDMQQGNDWQRTLATSIPFLLASIPLFWLHWRVIQRERKKVTP